MTDYLPGWPCAPAETDAPSVADRLSNPTAGELLPQVLALTPRGPAWGTDEAGDGQGASPVMRLVWQAIAKWAAASYAVDFTLAVQSLPSAVTWALPDWEAELGLPDPCVGDEPLDEASRLRAVRAKHAAVGGQSPAYYICLAASLGFEICEVEEYSAFRVGDLCGDRLRGPAWDFAWTVHTGAATVRYFRVGDRVGRRLAEWGNMILECAIRRAAPAHTVVTFAYDDCAGYLLDDDGARLMDDDDSLFLAEL